MSFTRENAGGWVAGDKITADQINGIDRDKALAVDGTNGGTYTLASALELGGTAAVKLTTSGGVQLGTSTLGGITSARVTGMVTLTGSSAGIAKRVDKTTLGDANATVDVSKDIWVDDAALTVLRVFTLRHSTSPVPVAGQTITITKSDGGAAIRVQREDATIISTLNTGAWAGATFFYDGAAWRLAHGTNITVGPSA